MQSYCPSRYVSRRRSSRVVAVGEIDVGGDNPIRIQSMTTTPTQDVEATVRQSIELAEAGCEIVRITAQNLSAARDLEVIARRIRAAKITVPLVADIHFLPSAAMEAARHVEKVRINPGNYADRKRFAVIEYSDELYESELQRLYETFSPIVKRCREFGRAMRIGTNHGSLSDRIMNRYGDTPLGMVESALEFIRICETHGFKDIILSMKSSNPKVMIEAYRLVVKRMDDEGMRYPLHLGVTEAGDGEDARIKSAIGIAGLLLDGLGDTIRVSLTEDPIHELPVARDLAEKAEALWSRRAGVGTARSAPDSIDPYTYSRRESEPVHLASGCRAGGDQPPRIIVTSPHPPTAVEAIVNAVAEAHAKLKEIRIEGLILNLEEVTELDAIKDLILSLKSEVGFLVLDLGPGISPESFSLLPSEKSGLGIVLLRKFSSASIHQLPGMHQFARQNGLHLAADLSPDPEAALENIPDDHDCTDLIFTLSSPVHGSHPTGSYRLLAEGLRGRRCTAPIWIRNTPQNAVTCREWFGDRLLEASTLTGSLLCDGIGDLISIETEPDLARATSLAYNILQGARARVSKTEYVACPSCGRTLFDLQSTTRKVRERTSHLKGVTIAIMGCIVNGPGEMADADFGYVGGAPGKVNLYVGKDCVEVHIPESDAVDKLVALVKKHGKWTDPPPH
jgi:(E)-4-hydroxy-3-methylbut-2-enyl-diphosphate synthase